MTNVYFKNFPKITYLGKTITDITKFAKVLDKVKSYAVAYLTYTIKESERPEDVAYKVYGDADLYWIVLLVNSTMNPWYDWPLSEQELISYVLEKYESLYDTHHYETIEGSDLPLGTWVNSGTPFSSAVTNYDYESALNEQKRNIKLLRQGFVKALVDEFTALIQE
jgi:hypothetical protein